MSSAPEPERHRHRRAIGAFQPTPKNARIARVRRVKVDQSYIDELLEEIRALRSAHRPTGVNHNSQPLLEPQCSIGSDSGAAEGDSPAASVVNVNTSSLRDDAVPAPDNDQARPPETGEAVRNPLLEDRPWFFSLTPEMPMLVEEAADAPFATRFRQELSGKSQRHIPRTEHVADDTIMSLWNSECSWPTPSKARFLLKVALNTVCKRYYLVRRSTTLRLLEQAIHNPSVCDLLLSCKLFALFALGELYSTRTSPTENQPPGIMYYLSANQMLRLLSERPRIDCVEVLLMLSLYSLGMNRRYHAYCMIGSAVKFGVMIGLHQNVPQSQLPDREIREHRKRVWWSAYMLDRFWAAMIGQPVTIRDEDIDVELPSIDGLSPESAAEDFADPEYLTASLRLTNLAAQIASSIYSRKMQRSSFSRRVQQALRDLSSWLQGLPDPLREAMEELPPNASMPVTSLHLSFSQCLIRAARPIVLHVFRTRQESLKIPSGSEPLTFGEAALALSDACIQCARRSCHILIDSWINGSFPTFEITYVQHLFASAIVLAISSLFQTNESQSDSDDFDAAVQILKQLGQNGNFAAREFSKHIEATRSILDGILSQKSQVGQESKEPDANRGGLLAIQDSRVLADAAQDTARMAFTEPSFQELLSQSDLDLRFLETSNDDSDFEAFFWPEEGFQGWMNG
ncbi:hypothetical protein ACJ41O_011998 [Fusarium nematophilum]